MEGLLDFVGLTSCRGTLLLLLLLLLFSHQSTTTT
jgi:hypothetical protein